MIALGVRLAWAATAAIAIGGALWITAWWAPLFVLMVPAGLIGALAAVLALEFAYAWAAARSSAAQPPALRSLLRAWCGEIGANCRLMAWRVPMRSARLSQATGSQQAGVRGLILVHGYGCNRAIWDAWLTQLDDEKLPCIAINLEPVLADIDDYGPLIERAVRTLQHQTGRAPVLVAHSMGGLAARAWWATDLSTQRLHRLVTIATPHQGTPMAKFGSGPSAKQMRPLSDWLQRLKAKETPAQAERTLCFYGDCDNMVIPRAAATLPAADNRLLTGWGHVAMVDHPAIYTAVVRCLHEPH